MYHRSGVVKRVVDYSPDTVCGYAQSSNLLKMMQESEDDRDSGERVGDHVLYRLKLRPE